MCYNYVEILLKYFDKNNKFLERSLNYNRYSNKGDHPLLSLLNNKDIDKQLFIKWIEMYFNLCLKCNIGVETEIREKCIQICKENENLSEYHDIINKKFEDIEHLRYIPMT